MPFGSGIQMIHCWIVSSYFCAEKVYAKASERGGGDDIVPEHGDEEV